MAALTTIVPTGRGVPTEITLTALGASNTFNNSGLATDLIIETAGTGTTVTIAPASITSRAGDSDYPTQTLPTISIVIGTNKRYVIPAPPRAYADTSGNVTFGCSGALTGVVGAAVKRVP